jgi:hypothetical protein
MFIFKLIVNVILTVSSFDGRFKELVEGTWHPRLILCSWHSSIKYRSAV